MVSPATIPISVHRERDAALRMLAFGIAFVALAGSLVASFCITPEAIESGAVVLWPTCTFRQLFDAPCPTCGLTRAFSALSHGRMRDALNFHGAAPLVYAGFWIGALASLLAFSSAARQRYGRLRKTAPSSH
jgi:hypothetical protein